MMHIRLIFLLLCTFICSLSIAQDGMGINDLDKKTKKQYTKAVKCLKEKHHEKGAKKIEEIVAKNPNFDTGREKLISYYRSKGNNDKASAHLRYLANSSENVSPKVLMTLADEYENVGDYDNAISTIEKLSASPLLKPTNRDLVDHRLKELKFRKRAYANPVAFNPESIGANINTDNSEYLPAFNADGSVLIYSSRNSANNRYTNEDLFVATVLEDGSYSKGMPIADLNTDENEAAHTLSQDGNILIFTACQRKDAYGSCDLYISFKSGNGWSAPQNLGPNINSEKWDAQPYLAADNKTLFFSSERPGGKGGRDIWVSHLGETGWAAPINLGDAINTKGNEESPFLHPDNTSFYFRSNGHVGMGDYDIFLALKEGNAYGVPYNLGYPINTKGSEGALFVELNGNKAYYATDAKNENKNLDILSFELPDIVKPKTVTYVKLKVVDKQTGRPLVSEIEMVDLNSNQSKKLATDSNGISLSTVTPGNYAVSINKAFYIFHSENIALEEVRNVRNPFVYIVELQKVRKPKVVAVEPIILKNVFFETGSASLLPTSEFEINKLYNLLNGNPTMNVKIMGHTDNVGQESDNLKLSEARAKAVYSALIEKGINRSRLSFEGKGESNPITSNDTAEGRQQNRRTEFVIIN